jgi:hypothetical protein
VPEGGTLSEYGGGVEARVPAEVQQHQLIHLALEQDSNGSRGLVFLGGRIRQSTGCRRGGGAATGGSHCWGRWARTCSRQRLVQPPRWVFAARFGGTTFCLLCSRGSSFYAIYSWSVCGTGCKCGLVTGGRRRRRSCDSAAAAGLPGPLFATEWHWRCGLWNVQARFAQKGHSKLSLRTKDRVLVLSTHTLPAHICRGIDVPTH